MRVMDEIFHAENTHHYSIMDSRSGGVVGSAMTREDLFEDLNEWWEEQPDTLRYVVVLAIAKDGSELAHQDALDLLHPAA